MSLTLARGSGVVAIVTGVAFIGVLFVPRTAEAHISHPAADVLTLVGLAGTLVAVAGLRTLHGRRYGTLGAAASLTALLGTALMIVSLAILAWLEHERSLLPIQLGDRSALFVGVWSFRGLYLGQLVAMVGFLLLGVASIRAHMLPRWCGMLIAFCVPLSILLNLLAGLGVAWVLVGYTLFRAVGREPGSPRRA